MEPPHEIGQLARPDVETPGPSASLCSILPGMRRSSAPTFLRLVVLAASLVPATSSRAADQVPGWATGGLESARESFTQKSRVPEGYDRRELEELLFPERTVVGEGKVEAPWLLVVKAWRASPGLSVAVLETVTHRKAELGRGSEVEATTLYVAVFRGGRSGRRAEITARCKLVNVAERHVRDLDVAPYRLAPARVALGVRTAMRWPLAGGGAENEYLSLLLPEGRELRLVWATLIRTWRMENEGFNEDGSSNKAEAGDEASATISVLGSSSEGLRDLRKTLGERSGVFRWNRTRYVTAGRDPVESVNGFPGAETE